MICINVCHKNMPATHTPRQENKDVFAHYWLLRKADGDRSFAITRQSASRR